jgi:hypothetical protein
MSVFQIIMLCAVLAIAWVSRRNWRGLVWLAALVLNYLVTSTYWRMGGQNAEMVAGLADAAVCIAIYLAGSRQWEMWVWVCFLASLLVNFLYLANNLLAPGAIPHDIYSSVLEALNITALIVIGGVSASLEGGYSNGWASRPWRTVFGLVRPFVGAMDADSDR